jgi:hypothetical protein
MRWKELSVRSGRMFAALGVAGAITASAVIMFAAPAQAIPGQCRIVLGDDGASSTIVANLDTNGPTSQGFSSVTASSFIRSTTGSCHFQIFNGSNFTGSQVTLGTNLNTRIRAGLDGVSRKDDGGGSTWRVRSVIVTLILPPACTLTAGQTNGVRMDYFTRASAVPAMNRVYALSGVGVCTADVHSNVNFGPTPMDTFTEFSNPAGRSFGWSMRSLVIR